MTVARRAAAVAGTAALWCWAEWLQRRWSRTLVGQRTTGRLVVLVPGYRNPKPTANAVNRWRVRTALATVSGSGSGSGSGATVVFSGGVIGRVTRSEAEVMLRYARSRPATGARMITEQRSRSSWENVEQVLPLLDGTDRIAVASQPAHALKVRVYLLRQRPELADSLVPAAARWAGLLGPLLAPLLAAHGLWTLRSLTRAERTSGPSGAQRPRKIGFRFVEKAARPSAKSSAPSSES